MPSRFELLDHGVPVPMEPQVYDVLSYLVIHRDRVVPKEELLDEIWGDRFVSESALTSRIKAARRALGDDGVTQRFIETKRGRGYRFIAVVADIADLVDIDEAAIEGFDRPSAAASARPKTGEADERPDNRAEPDETVIVSAQASLAEALAAHSAERVPSEPRHNLPVDRTRLVGREAEVGQIAALLSAHRLVTLLGIGGTGKTRLSTAVARDQVERFADGVWFVDLVPATTREQVVEAIADAAGIRLNEADVVAALAGVIANRSMLIVLDNCEHVSNLVAVVADELLARTSGPRFLATSREPLQLPDERQVRVAPLAVDDGMLSPAVQLFADAAERVGVVVGESDVGAIAFICVNLDGLPLSIELAAAQLRHLRLDELSARLDQRFELLARGRGGRVHRQASLLAVLQDTWDMLDDRERDLLLQLAAFASSFSVDDAEDVGAMSGLEAPSRLLAGLVDRGLVAGDGGGRHRLLETVKLFARQQWQIGSDPDRYLERHTAWMLEHLEAFTAEERYTSFTLLAWARAHYDDHRAVEERLLKAGRAEELVSLLHALTQTYGYETGTRASAVIERIEHILCVLELTPRQQGVLHFVAANAGLPARRPDRIASSSSAAVRLLRAAGEPLEIAAALIVGSWMTVFNDFELAVTMLAEASSLALEAGAPALADVAMGYSAGHHALVGRTAEAVRMLDDIRLRLETRPLDYAASIHRLYTIAVHIVDDPELSRAEAERLVADFADLNADSGIGWGLPISTTVAVAVSGDVATTRRLVTEVESLNRRSGNSDGLPDLLLPAAALAWRLGRNDLAHRWLSAVRRASKPTQNFHVTIMYRLLRREVGVTVGTTLTADELRDVYVETVDWMAGLS